MTAETDPIRVFARDGKWLVDYGSYAHGYHETRREAIGRPGWPPETSAASS